MQLNIGGVPEHFNLPWHLAMERGDFQKNDIDLKWTDYPGGTGAMCADLRSGKLDMAVLLTEGIVADIHKGNPSKIIQLYIKTPLIWGIHVPAASGIKNINDIQGKKYAISRLGSGSHLMAFVDAKLRGWNLKEDQLVVVNNLEGAREAFRQKQAEVFMWEKFMTKPLVDAGEFKRIGERPTPWPCFVLAAREEIIFKYPGQIQALQKVIIRAGIQFMNDKKSVDLVANKFNLKKEDAAEWFAHTKWSPDSVVEKDILENVTKTLYDLKLIEEKMESEDLCTFCELV